MYTVINPILNFCLDSNNKVFIGQEFAAYNLQQILTRSINIQPHCGNQVN